MTLPAVADTARTARRLHRHRVVATAAMFVAAQAVVLLLCWAALSAADIARAYVAGEALYSKAQKEAVIAAHEFLASGNEQHYRAFKQAIAVPQGDRAAREALERAEPDYLAAERGFRQGGIDAVDIAGMSLAFVWLKAWSPFAKAVADWRAADESCAKLATTVDDIAALRNADAPPEALAALHDRIDALDHELTASEQSFTAHIGELTRDVRKWAMALLALGSALLVAAGVFGVWRMSRKRSQSEQLAGLNEQRFRQFAEIASDWFCELDRDLRIVYLSERFQRTTGVPVQSVIGQSWDDIARRPWLNMQSPGHFDDLKARRPFRGHVMRHLSPDSDERYWSLAGTPVFGADGEFEGYRATGLEITDLVHANRKLQTAHDASERASVSKSAFLANMSHELRTPLNAIIGFSEVMKEQLYGPLGSDHYEGYVENIRSSGRHLLSLINDILDLSRVEAGKLELREARIYFSEIVDSAVSLCRERAERAGVRIAKELTEMPCVTGDAVRLKQILINLLSNAVKFTPSAGRVYIRTELRSDGALAVSVEDTGIGMSPTDVETALKPFGQVDHGLNRKYEGTGLGLPLAKTLIERHGGTFAIVSKPDEGTTVTFTLPASRIVAGREARASA